MSQDILMVADPKKYSPIQNATEVKFISFNDFLKEESTTKQYSDVLWSAFNSRGKYQRISQKADWIALALSNNQDYQASALIIEVGSKWLIEYVMTNQNEQGKGIGSAVMNTIMQQALEHEIEWIILNCDPDKNGGQLPLFYNKFGFKKI